MRPRGALLGMLLAALVAAPTLAQVAPEGRPSLAVVEQPRWTPGDFWVTQLATPAPGNNTTRVEVTARVVEEGAFNGTPAWRLDTEWSSFTPAPPDARPRVDTFVRTNRTEWYSQEGLRLLHRHEVQDRNLSNTGFYQVTTTATTTAFREPPDLYQFPLCGPCGDSWLVAARGRWVENTTYTFWRADQGAANVSWGPERNGTLDDLSGKTWLRQEVLRGPAGLLDVVVLQGHDEPNVVFDYWSPAAGNLARQEVLNATGGVVYVSQLTSYKHQKAPELRGPGSSSGSALGWPVAGALGLAAGAALLGGLWWWRGRAQGPQGRAAEDAGAGPSEGSEGPGEGSGGAPPGAG